MTFPTFTLKVSLSIFPLPPFTNSKSHVSLRQVSCRGPDAPITHIDRFTADDKLMETAFSQFITQPQITILNGKKKVKLVNIGTAGTAICELHEKKYRCHFERDKHTRHRSWVLYQAPDLGKTMLALHSGPEG